jgi:diguanylate cyclase (GGDEF)-like protein
MNLIGRLAHTIRTHPWSSLQDGLLLAAVTLVGVLLALEYDLLAFWSDFSERDRRIRVEEVLVLTAMVGLGILVFVMRRLYEERRDLHDRLRTETEMGKYRALALQDPLTGLPNRRALKAALEAAIATADARALALYLLDLNGFKRVNDEHGHAVGDEVLRAVAQRFRSVARRGDVVARLGGDEFAALACGVNDRKEASEIGHRFVAALGSDIGVGGRKFALGVAVGVALHPEDGASAEEILHHADLAMYSAKTSERSTLQFFPPPIRDAVA